MMAPVQWPLHPTPWPHSYLHVQGEGTAPVQAEGTAVGVAPQRQAVLGPRGHTNQLRP